MFSALERKKSTLSESLPSDLGQPLFVAANVSVSAHGGGGPRRMPADHPIADDHHLAVARAENAAELRAPSAVESRQVIAAHGDRHVPRDSAHRRQERQPAARIFQGLVGEGAGPLRQQGLGEAPRCAREMQIGKENLVLQIAIFGFEGFFDLENELRIPGLLDTHRARTGGEVFCIQKTRAEPRPGLHQHLMPRLHQGASARRRERHAVFLVLDLLRDPDLHAANTKASDDACLPRHLIARDSELLVPASPGR